MQSFIKVPNIQTKSDKNGRAFQTVTFNEVGFLPNGQEIQTGKTRTRNLWSTTETNKGDTLYGQLQVGSMVAGSIQAFNTTTYEVDGREVNKTTLVVFDFENPVSYANSQLKRNNACVVDEHGQPTAKFSLPTSVNSVVNEVEVEVEEVEGDLLF